MSDQPLATTHTVVIEGLPAAFVPQHLTVRGGDTVRWLNNSNSTHTTTSDAGLWNQTLEPGQSFRRIFAGARGTFTYRCALHPSETGSVTL